MVRLKVKQVKSGIGGTSNQRNTLRSLGLKRIHHSVVVPDNPTNRGYINRATHLLSVEEVVLDVTEQGSDS